MSRKLHEFVAVHQFSRVQWSRSGAMCSCLDWCSVPVSFVSAICFRRWAHTWVLALELVSFAVMICPVLICSCLAASRDQKPYMVCLDICFLTIRKHLLSLGCMVARMLIVFDGSCVCICFGWCWFVERINPIRFICLQTQNLLSQISIYKAPYGKLIPVYNARMYVCICLSACSAVPSRKPFKRKLRNSMAVLYTLRRFLLKYPLFSLFSELKIPREGRRLLSYTLQRLAFHFTPVSGKNNFSSRLAWRIRLIKT